MPEIKVEKKKKSGRSKPRRRSPARAHSPLYAQLFNPTRLWAAWEVVRLNAQNSKAGETRAEAERFKARAAKEIERIRGQIRRGTFRFAPARGALIRKKDGSKRPLVIAPIPSRIVQRAILDVLSETPRIQAIHASGFNYGGVPGSGAGVPGAVKKVKDASLSHQHYFRTDIRSFFRKVNRASAIAVLLRGVDAEDFRAITTSAVDVELDDAIMHGDDARLFPLWEEGVAQGSCLSPLLCNVLLHDFDVAMQGRGIITIRYIDDFIVLGKTADKAARAFESAVRKLHDLGLTCYDPRNPADKDKAEAGTLSRGAEFLGCLVSSAAIRPSDSNREKLLGKIRTILDDCLRHYGNPKQAQKKKVTYLESLTRVGETLQGWSNTFRFTTDKRLMRDIDRQVSEMLSEFEQSLMVTREKRSLSGEDWRRYFGVWLAQDALEVSTGIAP